VKELLMDGRLVSVALCTMVVALGATSCGGGDPSGLGAESRAVVTEIERC
jgi:hypothetical protein